MSNHYSSWKDKMILMQKFLSYLTIKEGDFVGATLDVAVGWVPGLAWATGLDTIDDITFTDQVNYDTMPQEKRFLYDYALYNVSSFLATSQIDNNGEITTVGNWPHDSIQDKISWEKLEKFGQNYSFGYPLQDNIDDSFVFYNYYSLLGTALDTYEKIVIAKEFNENSVSVNFSPLFYYLIRNNNQINILKAKNSGSFKLIAMKSDGSGKLDMVQLDETIVIPTDYYVETGSFSNIYKKIPSGNVHVAPMTYDVRGSSWFSPDYDFMEKDDNYEKIIKRTISKLIELNKLDLIFQKGSLFAQTIQNGFNFSDYKRKLSEKVNDKVTNLTKQPMVMKWLDKAAFDLQTEEGIQKVIPEELLGEHEGIPIDKIDLKKQNVFFVNGRDTKDQNSFFNFEWPTEVFEENDPQLDELKNFSILKDTDLTQYQFQYYKKAFLEKNAGIAVPEMSINIYIEMILRYSYIDFITLVFADVNDGDYEFSSILTEKFESSLLIQHYSRNGEDIVTTFYRIILQDKEVVRRVAIFQKWQQIAKEKTEKEIKDNLQQLKDLTKGEGFDAWIKGQAPAIEDNTLNEEDIKNRQKFFKQCALMMNMATLRDLYVNEIQKQAVPFDGRFIMAHCEGEDQEKLITNLISNKEGQSLIEAKGYQISSLVPKIRLYKVINETTGKLNEVEFIFPANADLDRTRDFTQITSTFLDNDFDKGSGCGIKQFSFEFNGTNPTEARSDIKADLTLYFQSFMDFIEERVSYNGEVYRFVDLIIQPKPDDEGKVLNEKVIHSNEYNPAFYRIRAEVGYEIPQSGDIAGELRDSIIVNNKSFYLCMVDHNLNFKNDGSVEIQISYRAYVETALKNPKMDALASPELIEKRIKNQEILENALTEKKCTKDQLRELMIAVQSSEEVLIKKSLSSILTRLKNRGAIYNVSLDEEDRSHFNTKGYFKTCRFDSEINPNGGGDDLGIALRTRLPEKSEDFSFTDSNNKVIQFFYFGDLLYTILDCVFDEKNNFRSNTMLNTRMILGSFEFESFNTSEQTENKVYNIAYMPISVDFFSRWFVDNVMSQKDSRKTFPVLNFVRNLSNSLIKPALLENCVNRKIENVTRFATTQVTGYYKGGWDMLLDEMYYVGGSINTSNPSIAGGYPLKGDGDGKTNINNFFSYIIVSTNGSSLTYTGTGTYADDIPKGRYHIGLGQDRGLVKNISFSKTDMQYIKEARFIQQGIDGLLQLASVYKLNVEMFGNTLFYPGMEFYFNPYGLGGSTSFGAPNKKGSIANKLGIGGYHTITSVKSTISPGKFTTSIQAQQYYSGDGTGNSLLKREGRKDLNIGDYTPESILTNCRSTILDFYSEELENENMNSTSIVSPIIPQQNSQGANSSSTNVVESNVEESTLEDDSMN